MVDEEQEVTAKGHMDYQDQVEGQKQPHSMDSWPPVQDCSAAAKDLSSFTFTCEVLP